MLFKTNSTIKKRSCLIIAYIYKITNDINGKLYIGKTEFSIQKRFQEHCKDAFRKRNEKRPLYDAIQKYGIEHFHIDLIEETSQPEEREIYWIEQYGSFKNGYNATLGGDGKRYADYDLIYALWKNENKSRQEIAELTGYDKATVTNALEACGVSKEERKKFIGTANQKPVACLDAKTLTVIETFTSIAEAERKYKTNQHIVDVCKGRRKTAGGYSWKFLA